MGASSPDGELTGDLGKLIETAPIGGVWSDRLLAGKVSPTVLTECELVKTPKAAIVHALHDNRKFSELFMAYLMERNIRVQEDLVDQLLNSTEKRLARLLMILANYGEEERPDPIVLMINQETIAEMIGTTRTHVNHFMNKFRRLGLIDYDGDIKVHRSQLNILLHEKPQIASRK